MTNITTVPVDKTPLQRAFDKIGYHGLLIAVFNGVLAAVAYIDSLNGGAIDWKVAGIVLASQAALALMDTTAKYFKSQNEPTNADLVELGKQEARQEMLAYKMPAAAIQPAYTPVQSAMLNDFSALFGAQVDAAPVVPASAPAPSMPVNSKGIEPAQAAPLQSAQQPATAEAPVNLLNTLPNISAINSTPAAN